MYHDQRGIVSIATTILLFVAALVIASSVQYLGIGELQMGFGMSKSEAAFQAADSCVQEALLRLKRSSAYTGGTLSVGDASCTIVVSGSGTTRTFVSTGTSGTATRILNVGVSLVGTTVTITSWSEQTT